MEKIENFKEKKIFFFLFRRLNEGLKICNKMGEVFSKKRGPISVRFAYEWEIYSAFLNFD